ncbi:carbohydrate ABC transporter permease [Microbacterium saperdae]|uniref:Raffinose/stachyose/melibiose transport system permease protein n=1 Tax=Microbacterium saperdae TaxID=69368 RepID=A0A543BIR0_9MICO|nr:sugar ABC transporter permease [Microbacterium saperdae]TQL84749.1 raffinose/stachyose/melibiose transport system permease protein [Microbacterium saperdae]GGM64346.1 ABC transporter permease [Microbacterium saperdae]
MSGVIDHPRTVDPVSHGANDGESSPAERRRRRSPRHLGVYLALAPLLITVLAFAVYPVVSGMFWSLFHWRPALDSEFIGMDNYQTMLGDSIWWLSFRNLVIIFVFGVVAWILPLLAAELLITIRSERWQYALRTLLILPMAFPGVVTALIWGFLYQPNSGVFNTILRQLGLGELAQNWTGDPDTALVALLFVGFPFIAGLPFLIFYSSLRNIPREVLEAAQLDGAGRIVRFFRIDLPLMATQMRLLVFLAIVSSLQYGFIAYVLTAGGPDNATMVPVLRMINVAFSGGDWGYAAALSTTLFLITLAVSGIAAVLGRRATADKNGGAM